MCSTVALDRDAEVDAALDTLQSALLALQDTDWQGVSPRVRAMQRLETFGRRQAATSTTVLGSLLCEQPTRLGGTVQEVVANRLRITPAEVRRRIRDFEQLGPRMAMTGQPLSPLLPATARHWRAGLLDVRHISIIERFFRDLPASTPVDRRESADEFLADKAASCAQINSRRSPNGSRPSSTRTAPSPTPIGPASAGSAGALRVPTG